MNAERDLQKRLLLAESDLHRSLLIHECEGLVGRARTVATRWAAWESWVSAGADWLAQWWDNRAAPVRPPSRWQLALDTLLLARSLWAAWSSRRAPSDRR